MDELSQLLSVSNKGEIIVTILAALLFFQLIVKLFDYFKERFGISTNSSRREKEQSEAITSLKTEVEQIKKDQTEVMERLNGLKDSVDKMQAKQDYADRARLKDRIGQAYRYYKDKGEWNYMEKEAFNDLVLSYEKSGGENSFIHDVCVPASLEWKIIN